MPTKDRTTLARRLSRLEARAEINDLIARYALGADRRNDPAVLGPLFTADAVWSSEGFGVLEGRDAIAAGLARIAADRVLWSLHFMVSPLVTLDADRGGRCRWYLWELCSLQTGPDTQDAWLGGWYDGEVSRKEGAWKFTSLTLDLRLQGQAIPTWSFKKPAFD